MKARLFSSGALLLLLGGCINMPHPAERQVVGFECRQERQFEKGLATVVAWVGPGGKTSSEVVVWTPSSHEAREADMTMRWEAHPPSSITWAKGLVMFDREIVQTSYRNRRFLKGLSLELRAHGTPPWEGRGAIRDSISLQLGVRLSADWADVQAMSQGSKQLYLIMRRKGEVIETLPLAQANFAVPTSDIDELLVQVRSAASDPEHNCHDFSQDTDIII